MEGALRQDFAPGSLCPGKYNKLLTKLEDLGMTTSQWTRHEFQEG